MSVFCKSARDEARAVGSAAVMVCMATGTLWASAVQAETCQLRIDGPPPSVRVEYDPFVPATAPARMRFRLANRTDQDCSIDLALTEQPGIPSLRPVIAPTGLMLEIRPTGQLGRASLQDVFHISVPAAQAVEVQMDVVVLNDAVVQSGDYSHNLTLELREPGQVAAYDQAPVVLTLKSLPRAQMNLSGARGDFGAGSSVSVVDFGEAETGKTRKVFIQTRANNEARLTFRSANQGRLLRVGDGVGGTSLAYEAALEGDVLNLTAIATRDIDPPRTYAGQTFELLLKLGQVNGAQAGDYSDELTIEISTL